MNPGALGKYAVDYEIRVDYNRLRRERLQRAKDQINQDGLGAIVTWDEANIRYLTSYYVTTPMRASEIQFVFIPKNGEPYLFGGGTPSETERRMPWMHGRVHPALGAPRLTANDADDFAITAIVDTIGKLMAEYGVEKEPIGIDGSTLQMLYGEAFGRKGIKAVHGKPTMDEARMIKTQDEIELMRITCANSEKAFAAIADAIRPGIRECDLVGIGVKALYEEGDDHTEDLVCCSGYNTNPYGWSFSDKPIRPGDDVVDKWPDSPSYWGYETLNEVLPYAIGHGIGLTLHDRPVISMLQKAVGYPPSELKSGMALALETYAGHKGGKDGVRLEENILVTDEGCEVLTRWPIDELMECWLPYR